MLRIHGRRCCSIHFSALPSSEATSMFSLPPTNCPARSSACCSRCTRRAFHAVRSVSTESVIASIRDRCLCSASITSSRSRDSSSRSQALYALSLSVACVLLSCVVLSSSFVMISPSDTKRCPPCRTLTPSLGAFAACSAFLSCCFDLSSFPLQACL